MTGSGLTGTGNSGANTLVTIGANTLVGGDGNDTFVFFAGSANGATVADFNRSEWDFLVFSGFGTEAQGATFTQIGTTDQWQIHSGLDPTTTRRSRSRTTPRCMPGISCSCEAARTRRPEFSASATRGRQLSAG